MQEVEYWRGIHIKDSVVWMDAPRKVNLCFMSHAHRCTGIEHGKVLSTEATAALCKSRGLDANFLLSPFNRPFSLGDLDLELHPAGHMPGSAQLIVKSSTQGDLLYTGHFDLRPHRTTERANIHQTQVLIMDSGWAHPQIEDETLEKVQRSILTWTKRTLRQAYTPVLLVESLGYAQEIVAFLLDEGLSIKAHKSIFSNCRTYSALGLPLDGIRRLGKKVSRDEVLLMPPHLAGSKTLGRIDRPCFALVSGSPKSPIHPMAQQSERTFFFSMAADYKMLTRYAQRSKAEKIYVVGHFASLLAEGLRSRGLNAWSLKPPQQMGFFS